MSTNDRYDADALSVVGLVRDAREQIGHVWKSIHIAAQRWRHDDAMSLAAAVSYYLALSLFPMLLLLTGGLGLVMRYSKLGNDAHQQIISVVSEHCSPTLEAKINDVLEQFQQQSHANGPIGALTSLMAALGVFYQFERAFDRIWRIPPTPQQHWLRMIGTLVRRRISAFFLLAGVGACILLVLLFNVAIVAASRWLTNYYAAGAVLLTSLDSVFTVLLNALAFSILYHRLPKRPVQWKFAFQSGLIIAVLWEIGRQLLASVVVGVQYTTAYGAIGSFISLLLWFYWGVALLLFGAEYVVVLTRLHQKQPNLLDISNTDENPNQQTIRLRRAG